MERKLHCGELIKRLNDIIKKEANNDLQEHGVTVVQMKVLIKLEHAPGSTLPLKELERYFDVSQATMAGVAVRLEKAGLVEGCADERDKRVKLIRLTDAGASLCRSTKNNMIRNERRLLSCLTEDERTQLQSLLYKVYESLGGRCERGERHDKNAV